jgi:ribosomal protein S18 acetylase RimI-like enzyme
MPVKYITLSHLPSDPTPTLQQINFLIPQLDSTLKPLTITQLTTLIEADHIQVLTAVDQTSKKIVGLAIISILDLISGRHAWLDDVVVDQNFRGEGIGTTLVKQAISLAKQNQAMWLDLTSRTSRTKARQLYLKLGFKQRDTNVFRYRYN